MNRSMDTNPIEPVVATSPVFEIPESNFESLKEKIAKISKKAVKLVGQPIVLTVVGHKNKEIKKDVFRLYYLVTVSGPQPKLAGWVFSAALDVVDVEGEKMVMIRNAPGESVPASFRDRVKDCDHCHTERTRKTLYILRKEVKP